MTPAATESTRRTESKKEISPPTPKEKRFDWPLCYEAEDFVLERIRAFFARNVFAAKLSERMRSETGTLLVDWVDYLVLAPDAESALR